MRVNYDGKFIFLSSISLFLMCSTDSWAQNKQNYNKKQIYPYSEVKKKRTIKRDRIKPFTICSHFYPQKYRC